MLNMVEHMKLQQIAAKDLWSPSFVFDKKIRGFVWRNKNESQKTTKQMSHILKSIQAQQYLCAVHLHTTFWGFYRNTSRLSIAEERKLTQE